MTISWRIKTTRVWSHHFCKKSPWDWTGFPSQDLTRLQYDSQAVFSSESPAGNLLRSSLGSGQNPTAQELQLFLAVTWRLPSPSPGRPWPLATWILQHSHLLHHAHGKSLWFSLLGRWRHWEPMSLPLLDILCLVERICEAHAFQKSLHWTGFIWVLAKGYAITTSDFSPDHTALIWAPIVLWRSTVFKSHPVLLPFCLTVLL